MLYISEDQESEQELINMTKAIFGESGFQVSGSINSLTVEDDCYELELISQKDLVIFGVNNPNYTNPYWDDMSCPILSLNPSLCNYSGLNWFSGEYFSPSSFLVDERIESNSFVPFPTVAYNSGDQIYNVTGSDSSSYITGESGFSLYLSWTGGQTWTGGNVQAGPRSIIQTPNVPIGVRAPCLKVV